MVRVRVGFAASSVGRMVKLQIVELMVGEILQGHGVRRTRYVNDATTGGAGVEMWQEQCRQQKVPQIIGLQHGFLSIDRISQIVQHNTGIVDEHVNRFVMVKNLSHSLAHRGIRG